MKRALLVAGAALCAAGCARMQLVDDGLGFERRQTELAEIADWDIRGGIVVDTGDGAYQSRFSWQQRGDELELEINGRLGIGRTLIQGNQSRRWLKRSLRLRIIYCRKMMAPSTRIHTCGWMCGAGCKSCQW